MHSPSSCTMSSFVSVCRQFAKRSVRWQRARGNSTRLPWQPRSSVMAAILVGLVTIASCFGRVDGQQQACTISWSNRTNVHSFGAVLLPQLTTTDDCVRYCAQNTSCVAVEVVTTMTPIACWVYVDAWRLAYLAPLKGVDQYAVVARTCTTLNNTRCAPEWDLQTGVHSFGSTFWWTSGALVDCLAACVANASCVAIDADFNYSPVVKCFMHVSATQIANVYPATNVNQYRLVSRCPTSVSQSCSPSWTQYNSTNSFNGVLFSNYQTLADCLSLCVVMTTCLAVDVNWSTGSESIQCWVHTVQQDVDHKNTNMYGITQYVLINKCADQVNASTGNIATTPVVSTTSISGTDNCLTWSCVNNLHSFSGNLSSPSCYTESACLTCCANDPSCVGVDIDSNANPAVCYTFSSKGVFSVKGSANGVKNCALDRRSCTTSTTTATSTTSTSTTSVQSTTAKTVKNTPSVSSSSTATTLTSTTRATVSPAGSCLTWSCMENIHSYYGNQSSPACYSESACKTCCANNPNCVGVDIDNNVSPAVCYTYTSSVAFAVSGAASGVKNCAIVSRDCVKSTNETSHNSNSTSCDVDSWLCDGDRCLPMSERCNNVFDCLDLSDELNCTTACQQMSGMNCADGLCILPYQWCDSVVDCPDFTDELSCSCKATNYRCADGQCIDQSLRCDGRVDCANGDDEFNCTCSSQYQCIGGPCLSNSHVCDGVPDCPSGDDEAPSRCMVCRSSEFACLSNKTCIPARQQCDGTNNCPDGSDEANCVQFVTSTSERRKRRSVDTATVYPTAPAPLSITYRGTSGNYYVCADSWTSAWSDLTCQIMGFQSSANAILMSNSNSDPVLVLKATSSTASTTNLISALTNASSCPSNQKVLVNCVLQGCGWRTVGENLANGYVYSGAYAVRGAWPWQVAIYYDGVYQCAGSIVANRWILTSARCTLSDSSGRPVNQTRLAVRAGSIYLSSADGGLQVSSVSVVVVNPEFSVSSWHGDLALVKLSKPLQFTSDVQSICLPPSKSTANDIATKYSVCVVAGWTPTRSAISSSIARENTLRQVRVEPRLGSRCVVGDGAAAALDSTLLCADHETSLPSDCTIVMGAAMVCRDFTDTWSQIGITLATPGASQVCGTGPFTNVVSYVDWINTIIQT